MYRCPHGEYGNLGLSLVGFWETDDGEHLLSPVGTTGATSLML